jgi:hypothetical protein
MISESLIYNFRDGLVLALIRKTRHSKIHRLSLRKSITVKARC